MYQHDHEDTAPDTALAFARARCRLYASAARCAVDDALATVWRDAERQARRHVERLGIGRTGSDGEPAEPAAWTCLIDAMDLALQNGDRAAAQLVAQECIAVAEAHAAAAQRPPAARIRHDRRPGYACGVEGDVALGQAQPA